LSLPGRRILFSSCRIEERASPAITLQPDRLSKRRAPRPQAPFSGADSIVSKACGAISGPPALDPRVASLGAALSAWETAAFLTPGPKSRCAADPPGQKEGFPSQAEGNPNPLSSENLVFSMGYPRFPLKKPSPLLSSAKGRLQTGHGPPGRACPKAPATVRSLPMSIASMGIIITLITIFAKQLFEKFCRSDHAGQARAFPL